MACKSTPPNGLRERQLPFVAGYQPLFTNITNFLQKPNPVCNSSIVTTAFYWLHMGPVMGLE